MTLEQVIDWALRGFMVLLTVWVYLWGKDAKQMETLLAAQFALRDQQINNIVQRLDHAGQKSSDEINRIMVKINANSERLAVLETQMHQP